jgi:hypothetical protein
LFIPRLDLQIRGIDAAVVRAALDRLPTLLATALKRPAVPTSEYEPATVRVSSRIDADALASTLAMRIAAVIRQRTSTPSHMPPTSAPPASMRVGVGDMTGTSEAVE